MKEALGKTGIYEQYAYLPCMTIMPRECFIMSGGNLLLFGLCMNRIGCVSITVVLIHLLYSTEKDNFVGLFRVLKRLCYRGNKITIYMRMISKMTTTNMTSQVMCSLTILYVFS